MDSKIYHIFVGNQSIGQYLTDRRNQYGNFHEARLATVFGPLADYLIGGGHYSDYVNGMQKFTYYVQHADVFEGSVKMIISTIVYHEAEAAFPAIIEIIAGKESMPHISDDEFKHYLQDLWPGAKIKVRGPKTMIESAECGDPVAEYQLAVSFEQGINGAGKDERKAFYWMNKAASDGNPYAMNGLGDYLAAGFAGVKVDYKTAKYLYEYAAKYGLPDAFNNLGLMYAKGEGIPADPSTAVQYFKKAADMGNADGCCNLGVSYLKGIGIQQNKAAGLAYLSMAMQNGSQQARDILSKEIGQSNNPVNQSNNPVKQSNNLVNSNVRIIIESAPVSQDKYKTLTKTNSGKQYSVYVLPQQLEDKVALDVKNNADTEQLMLTADQIAQYLITKKYRYSLITILNIPLRQALIYKKILIGRLLSRTEVRDTDLHFVDDKLSDEDKKACQKHLGENNKSGNKIADGLRFKCGNKDKG